MSVDWKITVIVILGILLIAETAFILWSYSVVAAMEREESLCSYECGKNPEGTTYYIEYGICYCYNTDMERILTVKIEDLK